MDKSRAAERKALKRLRSSPVRVISRSTALSELRYADHCSQTVAKAAENDVHQRTLEDSRMRLIVI
jgi:hypothetical protein